MPRIRCFAFRVILGTERHFIQKADYSRSVEANAERAPLSSGQNEVCRQTAVRIPTNREKVALTAVKNSRLHRLENI